ncbi:DUF3027 domain-containing protein [Actinomadura sp. ATCC 31491]|uniref:DUF3027 domain-containing protein n=1 Tax=Actinomadura luzonensis TaxID=2805427 RepID=A0ABT0FNS6_9ACTN|nr:DUF3027 domain-containing protein [Actinomadura luzonensis]MCK2214000.1 DUF3027 domain-containing protein [Actinomadura luzonensis]
MSRAPRPKTGLLALGALPLLLADWFIALMVLGRDCAPLYEGGNLTRCAGGLSEEELTATAALIAPALLTLQTALIILIRRPGRAPRMTTDRPWTGDDHHHNNACHTRWRESMNRSSTRPDPPDEWYSTQCGGCRFWIALTGQLGLDHGACTNPASPFDARVRFEHDGCPQFAVREDGSFG